MRTCSRLSSDGLCFAVDRLFAFGLLMKPGRLLAPLNTRTSSSISSTCSCFNSPLSTPLGVIANRSGSRSTTALRLPLVPINQPLYNIRYVLSHECQSIKKRSAVLLAAGGSVAEAVVADVAGEFGGKVQVVAYDVFEVYSRGVRVGKQGHQRRFAFVVLILRDAAVVHRIREAKPRQHLTLRKTKPFPNREQLTRHTLRPRARISHQELPPDGQR